MKRLKTLLEKYNFSIYQEDEDEITIQDNKTGWYYILYFDCCVIGLSRRFYMEEINNRDLIRFTLQFIRKVRSGKYHIDS